METERNKIEEYFEWWCDDMISGGYLKEYIREPQTMNVLSTAIYYRMKYYKRKENAPEEFNLFPKIDYTYDYLLVWTEKAKYIFHETVDENSTFYHNKPLFISHELDDEIVSYVDVKPTNSVQRRGGKVSSAITFPLKNRMIWDNYRIYINKVVPIPMAGTGYSSALFIKSFIPKRYYMTDGGGRKRKIKYQFKFIEEFVKDKLFSIAEISKLINKDKG